MGINTKEDWIELATKTIPKLPEYFYQFRNCDPVMMLGALEADLNNEDLDELHNKFNEIWCALPDSEAIHIHPFGDLCDLCSEYKVWEMEK